MSDERRTLVPGDRVIVLMDDGELKEFVVDRPPWQLGHGAWVVGLEGRAGGYSLDRVQSKLSGGQHPTATDGAGPAAGGRQAGEPVGRCEGCHFAGVVRIQVPNGVLTLCRQCLDTVNRKNPELVALRPRLAALEAAAGEALIPLAALVLDERSNGPIREICPELREAIRKALDACRAALAGGGG